MTNPRGVDGATLVACILFAVLIARSVGVCTFVFLSVNVNIFRVAAIQVQAKGAACPTPGTAGRPRPGSVRRERADDVPEPENRNDAAAARVPMERTPELRRVDLHSSPPPYSFSPPASDEKSPGPGAIVELYESIMASDAQTIQVQQQTMAQQQEIIRAQAQMILKLRHVLEEQDRRIEELDEEARSSRPSRVTFFLRSHSQKATGFCVGGFSEGCSGGAGHHRPWMSHDYGRGSHVGVRITCSRVLSISDVWTHLTSTPPTHHLAHHLNHQHPKRYCSANKMVPTLRDSTQRKTTASAKAAADAGYTRRPRAPLSRKQRYTCNKGLVSMKSPKDLQDISVANATNSPLLRLPAEIRNMIFKYAVRPTWRSWIGCYFNRQGRISRSGTSTRIDKREPKDLAIHLPRVFRHIYAETATLVYSENCFAFQSKRAMTRWLSKRLLAQREAIRWTMLPYSAYDRIGRTAERYEDCERGRNMVTEMVRKVCLNFVEMDLDDWLDECLCSTPSIEDTDMRCRVTYPSSGDEDPSD